jgi:hypothetical protein
MKKIGWILGFICLVSAGFLAPVQAQIRAGVEVGPNGMDAFHIAIGDYFKVSPQQIQACQDTNIPDEEQPVVFFIAQRANVAPESVILMRERGWSWMQIALHFRLNPNIFYTPGEYAGTPYENGQNAYRGHKRKINFSDADIVNFVNLKFASEHYGKEPQEIAKYRAGGRSFVDIHDEYSKKNTRIEWDAKEKPSRRHHQERDNR